MRLSIFPTLTQPWPDVLDAVRHAEATGWDGVYVADHFVGSAGTGGSKPLTPGYLESTASLAALAVLTRRVRLAPLVLGITYRHPAVVANWAATVDQLSGGRLLLGVGSGWQENEHDMYGIRLGPPRERIERFDEALHVLRGLLREERTTFEGRHYRVTDAIVDPKPVQANLPLLVGGSGDRMLALVARHADEWNFWSTPKQMAERAEVLERHCERIGRDPAVIKRSTQALLRVTDDPSEAEQFVARYAPQPAFAGTPSQLADVFAQWRDAGVDEVIVPDATLGRGAARADAMDAIAEAMALLR
ncbi:MAG TPA: TIGR03560 family F420-dependent LLM class oxidoreductase [Acidimicrobiales bacterium]